MRYQTAPRTEACSAQRENEERPRRTVSGLISMSRLAALRLRKVELTKAARVKRAGMTD
jgi:hypothetical protein